MSGGKEIPYRLIVHLSFSHFLLSLEEFEGTQEIETSVGGIPLFTVHLQLHHLFLSSYVSYLWELPLDFKHDFQELILPAGKRCFRSLLCLLSLNRNDVYLFTRLPISRSLGKFVKSQEVKEVSS